MTVEDSVRCYYQSHLVPEAKSTVKEMVEMVFYLSNQDAETLAGYSIVMQNTFEKLLMLIEKHEGR